MDIKKRKLFGQQGGVMPSQVAEQSGYMPQQGVGQIGGVATQENQQAPKRGGGFLGQGGTGRAIAGTIGDFLLQQQGMRPVYSPVMQQKAEAIAAQQRAESERLAARGEYAWKSEYDRANPKPVNNDTVADYEFIRQNLGDEQAEAFLKNKANPPQYRQGPDGQFYRIDTGGQGAPTAPVGKLTPIGGPASPAPGNFRP